MFSLCPAEFVQLTILPHISDDLRTLRSPERISAEERSHTPHCMRQAEFSPVYWAIAGQICVHACVKCLCMPLNSLRYHQAQRGNHALPRGLALVSNTNTKYSFSYGITRPCRLYLLAVVGRFIYEQNSVSKNTKAKQFFCQLVCWYVWITQSNCSVKYSQAFLDNTARIVLTILHVLSPFKLFDSLQY